ncbi:MAG: ABC transporter ATP-binding protein [Bacteroidetes bacterium]|nr:ABC transporter ATP-binding protein [Bacteroidota bacterium]
MISITDLSKKYGKLKVLDNINLEFVKGDSIALIGPNGSGKTTLIKCILGMVIPQKGNIIFDKKNIVNSWKYRSNIGYMPQIGRYPDNMTIGHVINMMKDIRKSETKEFDQELIQQYKLETMFDKRMSTLSGGTRQKVSASLAFLFNSEVLILDEPTAGLDPVSSEILKNKIIKERNKGKLILITSHILSELDEIINKVIYLQDGKLKFNKSIDEIKNHTGEGKLSKAIANLILNNNFDE